MGLRATSAITAATMLSAAATMNTADQLPVWVVNTLPSGTRSAGTVSARSETGTPSTLKSLAIGASWAVAISPPAPTMTNMRYMTKNGDFQRPHFQNSQPLISSTSAGE